MRTAKITALLIVLFVAGQCDGQTDLQQKLSRLVAASADESDAVIDSILELEVDIEQIAAAISKGISHFSPDDAKILKAGWSQWDANDKNGVNRPYQIYVPESVANGGEKPIAIIVHMHGAVSKPDFGTGLGTPTAVGYAGFLWPKLADKENFVIACPLGKADCAWWTDSGVAHVDAVVRDLKRRVEVPEDAIFGTGFSDGASGCYYRAMAKIDPFAGFIAMNGHPAVASTASGKQVYLPNLAMADTIAAMTQEDSLYPSKSMLPHVQVALQNDASVLTISYPNMNHQPSYFNQQTSTFLAFLKNTKRTPRKRIRWYSGESETGQFQWLEILDYVGSDAAEPVPEFNVMSSPSRIRLGVQMSPQKPNEIVFVANDSAAASAGIKTGDKLLFFDDQPITDRRELRSALQSKSHGDKFVCVVQRGENEVQLNGTFPEFIPKPIYVRKLPTGFVDAIVENDGKPSIAIESTNVRKVRIWIPNEWVFDESVAETIAVTVNGSETELPITKLSNKEYLNRFATTGDEIVARFAYVDIAIDN